MFNKQNSQNVKIIHIKDIVSILIVFVIIGLSVCNVWGSAAISNKAKPADKPISTRNLAMFASIAYADLEKIQDYSVIMDNNLNNKPLINEFNRIKKLTFKPVAMVSDDQLTGIYSSAVLLGLDLSGRKGNSENTYDYLFYGLASTNEVNDWELVNYAKFNTTVYKGNAQFTAMTFKRGDDIVIAYRGTDFDDVGDWLQDICYGAIGYSGQELVAQDYARLVAEKYVRENKNTKIYVTGHSLGGYLAQIGAGVLAKDYPYNLKEVSYFNGMGLQFWNDIANTMTSSLKKKYNISNDEFKQFTNLNSALNKIQTSTRTNLQNWKKNCGGKLVAYRINGDLISALGVHPGDVVGFDAHNICINHHSGNLSSDFTPDNMVIKFCQGIGTKLFNIVKNKLKVFNNDLTEYISKYGAVDPLKFIWITHETDGFFAVLPLDDESRVPEIKVYFENVPSKIRVGRTHDLELVVETIGGTLADKNLSKNHFKIANTARLKIDSITGPTEKPTDLGYKYTYIIKLRATYVIGNAGLRLKPNVLKININDDNTFKGTKFDATSNNLLIMNDVQIKLK